jgi:hypothetical protein
MSQQTRANASVQGFLRSRGSIFRYLLLLPVESVAASYGGAISAYSASHALGLFVGDGRLVDAMLIGPTFLLPIMAGMLGAAFAFGLRRHVSPTSYFAWIVPSILFYKAAMEVIRSPDFPGSAPAWNTLFGPGCGGSECLYAAFFAVPLVCGFSYSISSAFIQTLKRIRTTQNGHQ